MHPETVSDETLSALSHLRDRELIAADLQHLANDLASLSAEQLAECARMAMTDAGLIAAAFHNPSFLRNCVAQTLARVIWMRDAERCPICGGVEHSEPLPGTVGKRCVKCCGVTDETVPLPALNATMAGLNS